MTNKSYKTVIIGAGLSGISAANSLLKKDIKIIVLEKSTRLGGRAFSFQDPATKEVVDNGQHVIVGACKNFIKLISELGSTKKIIRNQNFRVPILHKNNISFLGSNKLPWVFGLFYSIINYKHLKFKDNLGIIYAILKIIFSNSEKVSSKYPKFGEWLKANKQNSKSIKFFWDIIIKPAVNDHTNEVSTRYAFIVIKKSFLQSSSNLYIGYPSEPLSDLWKPIKKKISDSNSKLKTKAVVKKFIVEKNLIKYAQLSNGSIIEADYFISTVPQKDLLNILKNSNIKYESLKNESLLESAPIICLHLWFDKSIMNFNYLACANGPTQWIFNVSKNHTKNDHHIVLSQSAAWEWIDKKKDEIKDIFLKDLHNILPKSKESNLIKYTVVKQKNATFRCEEKSEGSRQFRVPNLQNLSIAGDWTETGWPATMEGAVISGNLGSEDAIRFLNLKN